MPILSYFALVGSVLVALLFVADATLEKSGPLPFNNESMGLPKPWQPDTKGSMLAAASAPEPDMMERPVPAATTPVVPSAAIPAPAPASKTAVAEPIPARTAKAEAVPTRMAKVQPATKKPKRVLARKQPRPDGDRRNYAWSRNGNDGGFFSGGNSLFGRF